MNNFIKIESEFGLRHLEAKTIYCIGRNYAAHAAELNNPIPTSPVVFLKSSSSLRSPEDQGYLGFSHEPLDHETEVVALLGRTVPRGQKASWSDVRGLALGLDLTRREQQSALKAKGLPWTLAKSFDGAAVVSNFLPLAAFANPDDLSFSLSVEGELRQQGHTRQMLFAIPTLLTYLAEANTLRPGDLLFSGTPAGVAPMRLGQKFVLAWASPQREFHGQL